MALLVALRSCHLSLSTMMMALIRRNSKRFIMDHKAYMYVLKCRDGSSIRVIRLTLENASLSTIVGREPNIHEHACQSNLSMLKVLPVRKKPCQLKLFSSVRSDRRRKDFYLKIKIEIYSVILKNREESFDSSYFCQKAKKMLQ